jgi:tetratricopeptide (TPR) repeat protein
MVRGFRVFGVIALLSLGRQVVAAEPPGSAGAGRVDELDRLVNEGIDLRTAGQPAQALERFKRACELERSARTLGHLALAEAELKQWLRAEEDLQASLAERDSEWLRQHRKMLEEQLSKARTHVGDLVIIGPVGAAVFVDGRRVGVLPMPKATRVGEGRVVVTGQGDGIPPLRDTVTVLGGGVATVELAVTKAAGRAAGSGSDVAALIEQGRDLRRSRNLVVALELFKQAHALRPSAQTFTQMALTEQMLERWATAEEHFVAALAYPHDDPWLQETPQRGKTNRAFAQESLASVQRHIGEMEVEGAAGTEIWLPSEANPEKYQLRGRLPFPKPVRAGEGQLELRVADADQPAARIPVSIVAGRTVVVAVPATVAGGNLPDPRALAAKASGPASTDAKNDVGVRFDGLNQPFWTGPRVGGALAAGVGVGSVGFGTWWLLSRSGDSSSCATMPPDGFPCGQVSQPRSVTPGVLALALGGIAIAGGSYLLFRSTDHDLAIAAAIGPGTLAVGGTW